LKIPYFKSRVAEVNRYPGCGHVIDLVEEFHQPRLQIAINGFAAEASTAILKIAKKIN